MKEKVLIHRKFRVERKYFAAAWKEHDNIERVEIEAAWDDYEINKAETMAWENGFHGDYEWMIGD